MMYIDQTACSDLQRTRRLEWLETNGLGGFSSSTIIGLNTRHRPEGPNGIAFSPDERYLYVTNWDEKKKIVMRYEVLPDGTLKNGKLFFDMTNASGDDALDGLKIDRMGNLYVSAREVCGSCRQMENTSAPSLLLSILTTWLGVMRTARRCTCARVADSTACG